MKLVGALFCALLTTACSAQPSGLQVALDLYKTCAKGVIQATTYERLPTERADITDFVLSLDKTCYTWTGAWFPVFYKPGALGEQENKVFNDMRLSFLRRMAIEIDQLKK